jgi:uncharacterized protein (TIGR02270 family)
VTDIIPEVIAQHAEEAAFLWLLRDTAVNAPNYVLWELARLDNRVEAHLDGLRIAGDPGWEIIEKQLDANQGPSEIFVAAFFAFETNQQKRIDKVLQIAAPVPPLRRAVISALGWLPQSVAIKQVQALSASSAVGNRHIVLGGAVAHRHNPGLVLEKGLADLDLPLRARALHVVGVMGYAAWSTVLRRELRSADLPCRSAAAWSLARLTSDAAPLGELQAIALAETKHRLGSVNMLMRRLDPPAARRLIRVLDQIPGGERVAVYAVGALGDPAEIPFLLERMKEPGLARLAGEAFSWITGVDLALAKLEATPPEGFESGPNEDPLDKRVDLDPDEHLPWPHLEKLKTWWGLNKSKFHEGTRYLVGQPTTPASLQEVLHQGNQRQRFAAALELGLREPGRPIFEIRAPGFRQ